MGGFSSSLCKVLPEGKVDKPSSKNLSWQQTSRDDSQPMPTGEPVIPSGHESFGYQMVPGTRPQPSPRWTEATEALLLFLSVPPPHVFLGLLAAKILMAIGFPPLKGKIANQLFLNSTKPTDLGYHPFIDCLVSGFVYPFLEWNMDVLPRKKRHLRSAGFITSTYQVMSRMISPLMWVKQQ